MAMNTGSSPTKPRPIESFESTTLKTAVVDVAYSVSVATAHVNPEAYPDAKDSDIVYSLKEGSELPAGLILSADGMITGTPKEEMPYGNFTIVASFMDDAREVTFSISVINAAGSIVYTPVSTLLENAKIGEEYMVSVADAKIEKPDATQEEIEKFPAISYSIADGSALPRGLVLSADGTISGTPKRECKDYQFSVVASALGYKDRTATFTISILFDMNYEVTELADARFGYDYLASVATAECENAVSYALQSGSSLPKGLTLTEGGYIVGKPNEVVTDHEFTVVASAAMSETIEVTYSITVGIAFNSGITLSDGKVGASYLGVVSATGTSGIQYALKAGDKLPAGLTLSANGEISGKPTKAGVYTFTVVANAEGKLGDEIELTLYIANSKATASNPIENVINNVKTKMGCNSVAASSASIFGLAVASLFILRNKKEGEDK